MHRVPTHKFTAPGIEAYLYESGTYQESPIARRIFDQIVFASSDVGIDDLAPHDQSITHEETWFMLWLLMINNFVFAYEKTFIDDVSEPVRQVHTTELATQFDIDNMCCFYDEHIQPHINTDFELHEVLGGYV